MTEMACYRTKAERTADHAGETVSFHKNTMIPQWVMDQDGVEDDWEKFEELFLTDFTSGEDYFAVLGANAGIVACTAEDANHRRIGAAHRRGVQAHVHRLPSTKSVATKVSKHVRLVLAPEEREQGQVVASGAAVLVFRTKVTDIIGDDEENSRPATEAIKHVKKSQIDPHAKCKRLGIK